MKIANAVRMNQIHSDIRGPLYQEALKMMKEGTDVLRLNTGNPANFGFGLPDSVREALLSGIDRAVAYCDSRGMPDAREAILAYHRSKGLTNPCMEDIFVGNGVSEKQDGPEKTCEYGAEVWETIAKDPRMFGYAGGKMIRTAVIRDGQLQFKVGMRSQEDLHFFLSVYPRCETICCLAFYGYRYDFTESKRRPVMTDFIGNQLKILSVARPELSDDAKRCVADRVAGLIYSGLYDASRDKNNEAEASVYASLEGLVSCLSAASVGGERAMIIKWFLKGKYRRIGRYFRARQAVMRLLGRKT